MRSPWAALGWDFFSRVRGPMIAGGIVLLLGGVLVRWMLATGTGREHGATVAYALTALILTAAVASVHFTEGAPRRGLGGFPSRLYQLPIGTGCLVAVPLVCGALTVVGTYLVCVLMLLHPLGRRPPLLWPSLYLVAGVAFLQSMVWSLAFRPRLRLLCLGIGVALLASVWMFFLPDIYLGTLTDLGFSGDPERFMTGMQVGLGFAGPAAFGLCWNRVRAQRHRRSPWSGRYGMVQRERVGRLWAAGRLPFPSAARALVWHEFRRTGWIHPGAVAVLLLMTALPTALAGDGKGRVTAGVMVAMVMAPLVLAKIVGCGLAKPDFWSDNLRMSSFQAALPVTAGSWVRSKWVSALWSSVLTGILTLAVAAVWLAWFGDFATLENWRIELSAYYTWKDRVLLMILAPCVGVLLSWRFLVSELHTGLSGVTWLRRLADGTTAVVLTVFFAFLLRGGDSDPGGMGVHSLPPWIERMPGWMALALVVKMIAAVVAWDRVRASGMLGTGAILAYWAWWVVGAGVLAATGFVLFQNLVWLRSLICLAAMLVFPLVRSAVAILALSHNRSHR